MPAAKAKATKAKAAGGGGGPPSSPKTLTEQNSGTDPACRHEGADLHPPGRQRAADLPVPDDLGEGGQHLWGQIVGVEGLELRADEAAVLEQACRVRDEIDRLGEATAGGPVVVGGSRGQPVIAPEIAELRLQRAELARLLRQLAIPDPPDDDGDGWDGLSASQRARKAAGARWGRA